MYVCMYVCTYICAQLCADLPLMLAGLMLQSMTTFLSLSSSSASHFTRPLTTVRGAGGVAHTHTHTHKSFHQHKVCERF